MITVEGEIAARLETSVAPDPANPTGRPSGQPGAPRLAHLAPSEVGPSPWFPRNQKTAVAREQSEVLLASIRHFGGNLQPIKVRPVCQRDADERETRYELVYGGRRLQTCAELNLPVLALIEELTDQQAFAQANSEQFHAPNLSFLERGTHYANAIDQHTFDSARELSAATGTPGWVVDRSLAVNTLMEVIEAMLPTFGPVHEKLSRDILDFAERCPDKIIALSRSTHALHWLHVIQAVRCIDPHYRPDAVVLRRAKKRDR